MIRAQGGHYLMIVKRNQRQLWEDLELLFRIPPIAADQELWDQVSSVSKGLLYQDYVLSKPVPACCRILAARSGGSRWRTAY